MRSWLGSCAAIVAALMSPSLARASEAELVLPKLSEASLNGVPGSALLGAGVAICIAGLVLGLVLFLQVKALPVHKAMLEISDLIYETCKTYVLTQARFIFMLWVLIAAVAVAYFGWLLEFPATRVLLILGFSVLGILGSVAIAWFGMRLNTYANSRAAFDT